VKRQKEKLKWWDVTAYYYWARYRIKHRRKYRVNWGLLAAFWVCVLLTLACFAATFFFVRWAMKFWTGLT
jgi:hypothetical protein